MCVCVRVLSGSEDAHEAQCELVSICMCIWMFSHHTLSFTFTPLTVIIMSLKSIPAQLPRRHIKQ